jgi:hypothetical protein
MYEVVTKSALCVSIMIWLEFFVISKNIAVVSLGIIMTSMIISDIIH